MTFAKLREAVNEYACKLGNSLYDGLGDFVTKPIDGKAAIETSIEAAKYTAGVLAAVLLLPSCRDSKHQPVLIPNYRLEVLDKDTGVPVSGARVSIYPVESTYDIDTDAGDPETLQPDGPGCAKSITGADGIAHMFFEDGKQYNVVVQPTGAQTVWLYKLNLEQKPHSPNWNVEVSCHPSGDINFSGHIKHDESYSNGDNVFLIGEELPFVIKGVNTTSDESSTASFRVVRDLPGCGDPTAYEGSTANPDESLPAGPGEKPQKVFYWEIDPTVVSTYGYGKYKIHTYWEEDGQEYSHLIGVFFVDQDVTSPVVNSIDNTQAFTDETIWVDYGTQDPAQAGTVRVAFMDIASVADNDEVYVDRDITVDSDSDGDSTNDADMTWTSSPGPLTAYGESVVPGDATNTGLNAKPYTIRIWKADPSGNTAFKDVVVNVHVTKAEADALADIAYYDFGIGTNSPVPEDYKVDEIMPYARGPPNWVFCNRWNNGTSSGNTGHNYNREQGAGDALTDEVVGWLRQDWTTDPMGGSCIEPIDRCTKADFQTRLQNYLQFLQDAGKF